MVKTILLENGGLLYPDAKQWITKIDKDYLEVNSEVRNYDKAQDLYMFAMLIDPKLENLATSSGFPTMMGFDACQAHGNIGRIGSHGRDFNEQEWTQLEYYTWLIYEAVGWRKTRKLPCLNILINYYGEDFLKDVNDDDLGPDVKRNLSLMMYQNEGFVKLYLYKDYKPLKKITKGDQLKFTR